MARGWQFWIDRGGTFTDVIGVSPQGAMRVRKVPSAGGHGDAGLAGVRSILEEAPAGARVERVKVGTTVATNALLERKGEPVLLVTTQGFNDALAIGYQNRPDIFARRIVLPARLYARVIEARERIDCDGRVLTALDESGLRAALEAAHREGLRAAAIVFLHGWNHTGHERRAAMLAREVGFEEVSVSHELSPLVRFVARGDTTVLNAYLAPVLDRYVRGLARELATLDPDARLELMQSNGGLADAASFRAMASVLSGPAGGLIGMAGIGRSLNEPRLIGFDMGGTSTDVSLYDGEIPQRFEHRIAGIRLQSAMLDVHTIAAGGGSVLRFEDGRLAAGPASAGADPGPACYGRGGPLTLTDVQVALGRLRPDTMPARFGADGASPIDRDVVLHELSQLARRVAVESGRPTSAESLAEAYLGVAVESMANAIRHVAMRQGHDAGDFTLFCFGGAAGQHVCRVAEAAGMRRALVHPLASVLSAFGIGIAPRLAARRASLRHPLSDEALIAAASRLDALEREARDELQHSEPHISVIDIDRRLELRAGESETSLSVSEGSLREVREAFAAAHRRRFGIGIENLAVVIETVRVEARAAPVDLASLRLPEPEQTKLPASVRAWFGGGWCEVPLVRAGPDPVAGPALIVEPHSTLVVEPGWVARGLAAGEISLEKVAQDGAGVRSASSDPDPARIEIFDNLFMHVAEQMGEVLRQTAQSVNIKERLDYSCALFDQDGGLVANAPHMPVHLGSMGASVRAVIDAHASRMRPGDSWLINSPYHGGTHLPDMTVVTPVFLLGSKRPQFFVASRAHHADIGGTSPGSMPAFSSHIDEEGTLFESFPLVRADAFDERGVRKALARARYPARNPDQNVADLRGQLAANARGIAELERAARRHGIDTLRAYMRHVQANAAECVRHAIERLSPGRFRAEMDGGQAIEVRIDVDRAARRARIDFTGTTAQGPHNFNAPRAVCTAAVLYVFRTLVERPIPLNEGCVQPLEILIPQRSMLDPVAPAAVAAGNVETSQCIVDALYGALGELAASQGTMNNLTFGDARLQYYETIAGGSGAGPGFEGCDAVQTHMTNSRLTDPEILESAFPVLLREFSIRRGSGGKGRWRGGDGVIRRLEFRAPMSGALLANRRRVSPFGLAGGGDGAPGRGRIVRANGATESLAATARFDLAAGDVLEIETPGGGAFGAE